MSLGDSYKLDSYKRKSVYFSKNTIEKYAVEWKFKIDICDPKSKNSN